MDVSVRAVTGTAGTINVVSTGMEDGGGAIVVVQERNVRGPGVDKGSRRYWHIRVSPSRRCNTLDRLLDS